MQRNYSSSAILLLWIVLSINPIKSLLTRPGPNPTPNRFYVLNFVAYVNDKRSSGYLQLVMREFRVHLGALSAVVQDLLHVAGHVDVLRR